MSKLQDKNLRIAIIGATGIVGRELLAILEQSKLNIDEISLYASKNSAGEKLPFNDKELVVKPLLNEGDISANVAFFAAGSKISQEFLPDLAKRGVMCIDKSSAFRLDKNVPLVVAGVNDNDIDLNKHRIIASPNCVATPLAQVLAPLHKKYGLKQVIISTYQAVSGAGNNGTKELETQVRDLFNMRDIDTAVFKKRIAFNALPMIPAMSAINTHGKTEEEEKAISEFKKILHTDVMMEATCVRVPIFNGHCMSVSIETRKNIQLNEAIHTLNDSQYVIIIDKDSKERYPTAIDASGRDETMVGRIRPNTSVAHGLSLWIASDNLRTGAALNAVRIVENIYVG